jgi:hypothetical protein
MPSYTCDEVNNMFLAESGRIGPSLAKRVVPSGPWLNIIPRAQWEDGMGVVHNSMVWERTLPNNNGDEWVQMNPSDGAGTDQCTLTPEILKFGQTLRSMRKFTRNIRTDWFCVEDLRDDFSIAKMLGGVQSNLSQVTDYVWENRNQDEYIRLAEHKITENGSFDVNASSFNPATPPTSKLTVGTLRQVYQWLVADGVGIEGAIGTSDGGHPVLSLFTDMNTDLDLIQQDPAVRRDFQYSDPTKLSQPFGMAHSWDNYKHVFNRFQPRYEIVGGQYVRIQPYKEPESTTKGWKRQLNPAYIYASYADSIVVIPSVYTMQVPRPITSPGGGLKFDPVNYMGDFAWLNIKDVKCNPRGTKGFFDAVYTSASDPGQTWFGVVIRHKNCSPLRVLKSDCYERNYELVHSV